MAVRWSRSLCAHVCLAVDGSHFQSGLSPAAALVRMSLFMRVIDDEPCLFVRTCMRAVP